MENENNDIERGIIYLALSNLIKDSLEFLEGSQEISKEDRNFIENIIYEADRIMDKYEKGFENKPGCIGRPNWDEI